MYGVGAEIQGDFDPTERAGKQVQLNRRSCSTYGKQAEVVIEGGREDSDHRIALVTGIRMLMSTNLLIIRGRAAKKIEAEHAKMRSKLNRPVLVRSEIVAHSAPQVR